MEVHVATDKHIANDARLAEIVSEAAGSTMGRFLDRVTRLDAHFADENAGKGGDDDMRCSLEARLAGHQPVGVSHRAANVKDALTGALSKLSKVLGGIVEKEQDKRRVS